MAKFMPTDYAGQELCERCGVDSDGNRFYICAEMLPDGSKLSHDESCALYPYHYDGLCDECDQIMRAEFEEEK